MAKREKERKPIPSTLKRLIDFLLSVLSGVVAAAIWYMIERFFTG